tara:strand:- start:107 stop:340 length:234 start_codon:yes stop_codon:yes gene_type:complete
MDISGACISTHRASLWIRGLRHNVDALLYTYYGSPFLWLQAFANVEGLFDRLATYVRARLPQIRQIHEKIRDGVKIH